MVGRKICIIFVEIKEKLKIMSKSIVEMYQYFKERPGLWAKLSGVMSDGSDGKIEQCRDSVVAWAQYLVKVRGSENFYSLISSSIMDAFSRLEVKGEVEREAGEEFKRWYLGEWQEEHVVCYKGFNKDLTCRDFQYEIGKEYEIGEPICMCECGFHACKDPLAVFDFYMGIDKRYCIVEQWGYMEEKGGKTVSSNIKIVREISLKELFEIAVERKVSNEAEMHSVKCYKEEVGEGIEEKKSTPPSLYNDNIREIKDISLWLESFMGNRGAIIVRESIANTTNIIGDENIIGVMGRWKKNNVLGSLNTIYVLDCDNDVNITGHSNNVYVADIKDTQINVQGVGNSISIKGKADVVCVGEDNVVQAGIGSTLTFADGTESKSVFIDGERYTDKETFYFKNGVVASKIY